MIWLASLGRTRSPDREVLNCHQDPSRACSHWTVERKAGHSLCPESPNSSPPLRLLSQLRVLRASTSQLQVGTGASRQKGPMGLRTVHRPEPTTAQVRARKTTRVTSWSHPGRARAVSIDTVFYVLSGRSKIKM